jgi:hypothetical protein
MKLRILTVITALAVATSACNLSNLMPFSNSNTTSNQKFSQVIDPKTQPIQVTTTLDQSHATTAIIGPDGGTLSTTGADGSRFTLEIPPKALVETIEVSMIPITSMDGIPWKSGPVAAVQLEPDGQTFYGYVTLTIEPAGDIPVDQAIPVGASGPGHDLYIPAVDPKSATLQLKLGHFSSAGATKGLLADTEPWRQRLGGDVEARLGSIVAAELEREKQAILAGQQPNTDPNFWDEVQQTWIQYVLKPRLAAAGQNCAAGQLALQTVLSMQRQAALGGWIFSPGINLLDLIAKVGKVCLQEEYELCRDQHIIHRMMSVVRGIERQNQLLGVYDAGQGDTSAAALAQLEAEGWDLARKCLHFELRFKSTANMSTADGSYTSTVEATVPIELNASGLALEGSADLINTDFSMKPKKCSAQTTPGGGTFKVISLVPIDAAPDANHPYGYVKAIHLTYAPGYTSEKVIEICPGAKPAIFPPMGLWSMAFQALHVQDMGGGGQGNGNSPLPDIGNLLGGMGISNLPNVPGLPQMPGGGQSQGGSNQTSQDNGPTFLAKEWAVRNGELFASKQWDLTVNLATSGEESGTFELYHKPQ